MGIFGKPPESKPDAPAKPSPAPETAPAAPVPRACVIGPRTTVKGELVGDEDVLVQGAIEGQVRLNGELRVEAGGRVKASVEARSVVVAGEVVGDCTGRARVEIQASGRVTGDLRAPKIVIAEGAVFRGRSDMSSAPPPKEKAQAS